MKITIEINDFDELKDLCMKLGYLDAVNILKDAAVKQKETAPDKDAVESEDVDKLRSRARRLLSKANKKAGEKVAQEWIKEAGIENFSETTDAEALTGLIARAEEYLA